jgi:phosphoribosylanthranilate isomerase
MKVKVCGMKEESSLEAVTALGPDALGFIFYEKSPRHVLPFLSPARVRSLAVPEKVGVFVDALPDDMRRQAEAFGLTTIQLHGNETPDTAARLRADGLKVWKVFGVSPAFDFGAVRPFEGVVDHLLFDTAGPKAGGNGFAFPWQVLDQYTGETTFLLSGGIGPDSLEALSAFSHPRWAGIDLNSRFEIRPGEKDPARLAEFIAAFRQLVSQKNNILLP